MRCILCLRRCFCFKRKATALIKKWKDSKDKKCLVVQGARQTGKTYTTDLSLLISMKDFSIKQHIVENTLSGNTRGGIYECAVADAFYKRGYSLYFYKNESSKKEIDMLIQKNGSVVPVEVKSGNARATSLISIMEKKRILSTDINLLMVI